MGIQGLTGCIESGNHGGCKCEPKATDGAEDNAGESVSKDELEDTRDEKEKTTKEDDGAAFSSFISQGCLEVC